MRKHFLILMLMALLPFAGWAANVVVVVQPLDVSKTYGTADAAVTPNFFYQQNADNVVVSGLKIRRSNNQSGEDVDDYTYTLDTSGATVEGGQVGNTYTVSATGNATLTITPKTITAAMVSPIPSMIFVDDDTQLVPPSVEIIDAAATITTNDYTLSYGDNNSIGTTAGKVYIQGKGNYTTDVTGSDYDEGKLVVSFAIGADITNYKVTVSGEYVYTGENQLIDPANIVVRKNNNTEPLEYNTDYTLEYSDDIKNFGEVTVRAIGMANYAGTATGKFNIAKKPLTLNAVKGKRSYGYTNDKIKANSGAADPLYSADGLIDGHTVVAVLATEVEQTANKGTYTGVLTLNTEETKIEDADHNDVTANYNITWNTTAADLVVARQNIRAAADIKKTVSFTKVYDTTEALPSYQFENRNTNAVLVEGESDSETADFYVNIQEDDANTKDVGSYHINFVGINNYQYNAYDAFQEVTISARPITVVPQAEISVGYGTSYADQVNNYELTSTAEGGVTATMVTEIGDPTITYYADANEDGNPDGDALAAAPTAKGSYLYTVTFAAAGTNYDFAAAATTYGKLKITNASVTVKIKDETIEYGDGEPGFTLTYVSGLGSATDFSLAKVDGLDGFAYNVDATANADGKYDTNTTGYTVNIANGDYTYDDGNYTLNILPGKLIINKKNIANIDDADIAYDDQYYDATEKEPVLVIDNNGATLAAEEFSVEYSNNKLANVDQIAAAEALVVGTDAGQVTQAYKDAQIEAAYAWAQITVGESQNYTGTKKFGFTINKNTGLKFKAVAKEVTYDQAPTATFDVVYEGLCEENADEIFARLKAGENVATDYFTGKLSVINTQNTSKGLHVDALQPYAETAITSRNYVIDGSTYVPANFTITSGVAYVKVKDTKKTYGENDPEYTYVYVSGMSEGDALNWQSYITGTIPQEKFSRTPGETVIDGGYDVTIATDENGVITDLTSTNYTIKLSTEEVGKLTIEPRAITIKTLAQEIDLTAVTPGTFNSEAILGTTIAITDGDLANNVAIEVVDEISAVITGLTSTNKIGLNDINLVSAENVNYTVTKDENSGQLNIIGLPAITLGSDAENDAETVNQYAVAGYEVPVKMNFANRIYDAVTNPNSITVSGKDYNSWAAGQWNSMVLPFDITVSELSQRLGYAIVNVIDASGASYDDKGNPVFKFKLTMKGGNDDENGNLVLKANRPFVVKTADAVVTTDIDFGNKFIIAPTEDDVMDAGLGCKFVGTYSTYHVDKTKEGKIRFLTGDHTQWWKIGSSSLNEWDVVPFAAYIDLTNLTSQAAENAIFVMEELDGSTTVIRSINGDNNANTLSGEGWYNLNGMKMQNAPVEKGVYIQNGKKVVVK